VRQHPFFVFKKTDAAASGINFIIFSNFQEGTILYFFLLYLLTTFESNLTGLK